MSFGDLRKHISECNCCGKNFFCPFPTYKGVKGFYGDKDYIFVAAQPSMTIFPSEWDERLYYCMTKYNFQDTHLTDLVKCRREAGKELSQTEILNCIGWLKEEINIVNPQAIIALGTKKDSTYDVLKAHFRTPPVLGVTHYSNRFVSDVEYENEFKTLKYYLDSDKYLHGMKIKDLTTPKQRKIEERQQIFREFVDNLKKKGIKGKEYREAVAKWNKEQS